MPGCCRSGKDDAVGLTKIAGVTHRHPSWEERSPRSCRAVPPVRFRAPWRVSTTFLPNDADRLISRPGRVRWIVGGHADIETAASSMCSMEEVTEENLACVESTGNLEPRWRRWRYGHQSAHRPISAYNFGCSLSSGRSIQPARRSSGNVSANIGYWNPSIAALQSCAAASEGHYPVSC